jgi:carboxyl-terminal processing protease
MPKNFRIFSIAVLSILLLFLAFAMGWSADTGTTLFSHRANARLLNQAWTVITQNYVEPYLANSTILNEGAVKGMVQALNDPYSSYLNPDVYKLAQSGVQGTFSGIGAQVGLNNANQPVVLAPLENSPAAKAGVKTGDVILAVNGESTKGLSLTEVTLRIRGPVGTTVKLLIQHQGETTAVEIDIVRAQINAPTIIYKMMGSIAYIDISSFNEKTNNELNTGLQALDLKDSTGIILDLRDNPGGLVSEVVNVASHFIKSGVIITLVDTKAIILPSRSSLTASTLTSLWLFW